ncbi:hypothetical protein IG631_00196 [Alternaria alternata]|nr:hypothetical protein IG631_00196 [Alternaria alternata]
MTNCTLQIRDALNWLTGISARAQGCPATSASCGDLTRRLAQTFRDVQQLKQNRTLSPTAA